MMYRFHPRVSDILLCLALLVLPACLPASPSLNPVVQAQPVIETSVPADRITSFQPATSTPALTAAATETVLPSVTPTITSTPEPEGCQAPPEDYSRVEVNGWTINQRTLAMLQHTAELYGGELEITGYAITQGSYNDNGAASFGTHLGGGAVDLSVMHKGTYQVLRSDIEPLIHALRVAGFAAWMREYGELSADSPYHIHAIAIGDQELSQAAQAQLTGKFGYFRGYTGVPIADGTPAPDRHGGPILCQWMIDLGYRDLRGEGTLTP